MRVKLFISAVKFNPVVVLTIHSGRVVPLASAVHPEWAVEVFVLKTNAQMARPVASRTGSNAVLSIVMAV